MNKIQAGKRLKRLKPQPENFQFPSPTSLRTASVAVVNTCEGFRGVIRDSDGVEFVVEPYDRRNDGPAGRRRTSRKLSTTQQFVLFKSELLFLNHWINKPLYHWILESLNLWIFESLNHWIVCLESLNHWIIESLYSWII